MFINKYLLEHNKFLCRGHPQGLQHLFLVILTIGDSMPLQDLQGPTIGIAGGFRMQALQNLRLSNNKQDLLQLLLLSLLLTP